MRSPAAALRTFARDVRGSLAVQFAVIAPVLLLIVGSTIDYGHAINQRSRLQDAVDKAALAAARELGLSDARRENVAEAVSAMVAAAMKANAPGSAMPVTNATITNEPLEVSVTATQTTEPIFGGAFGIAPTSLEVNAVARIVGRPNICVLALDPAELGTISLEIQARVTGQNCAIFSNSIHTLSIKAKNSAVLSASMICTAGGKDGSKGNFTPEPLTDCPTFDDPLAGRPEPMVGACNEALPTRVVEDTVLFPGTYCGGLLIDAGATVKLQAGTYVIKDGEFRVKGGSTLTAAGAGLFFTGTDAVAVFERDSHISLAAPDKGEMAGLLIFESRSQPTTGIHQILSDDARQLLGTIYLPRGTLHVDANNPIADRSAYTAIVARKLTLYGGPHLVLNANYELTNVPVPQGIRGADQPVNLVR